jgi:malate dehydrogenase
MAMKRPRITVVGAGFTGATTAFLLAQKQLGDVHLIDVPAMEKPTQGKALDMLESSPIQRFDSNIIGGSSYEMASNSDIVIITAGMARKPGMSRDDLVHTNAGIVRAVCMRIRETSPDAIVLVLSNPVDAMTYVAYNTLQFPAHRVIGQSGVLDAARYRTFIAQELGVSVEDVQGIVLGGHGDDMVPLVRYTSVGGVPLAQLLPEHRIEAIVARTRTGGGEIVQLLGNGSAYYAPAASLVEMTEAIVRDKRRVLPAIARLSGQYGMSDVFMGVLTVLGGRGIERIVPCTLEASEQAALEKSAQSVRAVMAVVDAARVT